MPEMKDPTNIGEVSAPPFVRLPDSTQLFVERTLRLRSLSHGSELASYLEFVAGLTELQYRIQDALPEPCLANEEEMARRRAQKVALLDPPALRGDPALSETLDAMLNAASGLPMPEVASAALSELIEADSVARQATLNAVLANSVTGSGIAAGIFAACAAQVHFARCAARLGGARLGPVTEGGCPVCGSPPAATMIVGWQGAYGSRFCACSLCGTLWNHVRIKCVLCGSTEGIGYQEIDGGAGTSKAETCDRCHRYVKVFYQTKDHAIEPIADDVASVGLDMLMKQSPYRRGGANPFLLGY